MLCLLDPLERYCQPHSLAECCPGQLSAVALPNHNPLPGSPTQFCCGPTTEALDGSPLISQTGVAVSPFEATLASWVLTHQILGVSSSPSDLLTVCGGR